MSTSDAKLSRPPLLVVSGPTGSGKSSLAVKLAADLNAEVISVDSVQVYRGFDIGSAKIETAHMWGVPHHLIDTVEPQQPFDAAQFAAEASACIDDIQQRGRLALLCGGTTLYLKAVLYGLADVGSGDRVLRQTLEELSSDDLYARLKAADPTAAARLHLNDRLRIIRALETCQQRGALQSGLHAAHDFSRLRYRGVCLIPLWERQRLYELIRQRSAAMLNGGLLDETGALLERFGPELPALGTVGYRQALQHLTGALEYDELEEEIAQATRRLAKRQMTFWRNEPQKRGWPLLPAPEAADRELGAEVPAGRRQKRARGFSVISRSYEDLVCETAEALHRVQGLAVWYLDAERIFRQ